MPNFIAFMAAFGIGAAWADFSIRGWLDSEKDQILFLLGVGGIGFGLLWLLGIGVVLSDPSGISDFTSAAAYVGFTPWLSLDAAYWEGFTLLTMGLGAGASALYEWNHRHDD